MKLIRINNDGSMNDISITVNLTKQNIIKHLNNNSVSKGEGSLKELYRWKIQNEGELLCYGWYDGPPGFENKHDLPPSGISDFLDDDDSSDKKLLFGDIFIVFLLNGTFKNIDVSTYANYYELLFEGFDDCNTSDDELTEEEEELTEEDKQFIDDDDDIDEISDEEEYHDDDIEKLDIDENDYTDDSEYNEECEGEDDSE